MTLNSCKFKFSWNFALLGIFETQERLMNKDRPGLSATELLRTECTFQRCTDYVDIAGSSKWGPI